MSDLVKLLRECGDDPQDVSLGEWAEWSHKWADRIEELEAENADLKAKLEKAAKFLSYAIDMTGDPHCYHDHHGYCQAHNLEPKGECWVEQSQAFLAELTGGKDDRNP